MAAKMVKVRIPRGPKGAPNSIFIGINGENFQLKRGEEMMVPDYVAERLFDIEKMKDAAEQYIDDHAQ